MVRRLPIALWLILCYLSISFYEPFWRLFVRGLAEGDSFAWNYAGIEGRGTGGDFWIIAVLTALGVFLLEQGFRRRGNIFRWSTLVWLTLLLLSSLSIVAMDPTARIEADTLHFTVPYALLVLPLDIVFFSVFIFWFFKHKGDAKNTTILRWNRMNSLFLLFGLFMFPVEIYFLNAGAQDGLYDEFGVYITFVQWIAVMASLYPWNLKRKHRSRTTIDVRENRNGRQL